MNGVPAEQAEAVAVARRMHDWQARPAVRAGPFPPPQIRGFFASDHRYPPLPRPAGRDDV